MYLILVGIVVQSLILKYVLENERDNCECALTWHHKFIKVCAPLFIFIIFTNILFAKEINKNKNLVLLKLINGVLGLISLAYVITLGIYFFKLQRESNCDCSEDWKRNILSIPLVLFTIGFLVAFFTRIMNTNK